MKRLLCALFALILTAGLPALAEATVAPTIAPAGEEFAGDGLRVTLPAGLAPLEGDALAGYEAALEADYPEAARTLLAATDEARDAALTIAEAESDADCLDAAREAAESLIGNADAAREERFGENRCAAFSCAIGDHAYHIYYLSDGARLLIVGATGLETEEIEAMLASLIWEAAGEDAADE